MSGIRTVIDVPLVARVSTRPRADILTSIGVGSQDHRPLVLLSLRAGVNGKAVNRLAVRERDIAFLHVGEAPAVRPKNLHPVTIGNGVTFADLASIVDVVVGKPGYGTIAACVANRNRFLYVPREGFREDEILLPGAAGYVTTETLPLTEFETGEWGDRLRRILGKPEPERRMEVGGAQVCAEFIAGRRQDELRFPSFA